MGPISSPYANSGANIINLEKAIGAQDVTGAGAFEHAMLQALDRVSASQNNASALAQQALLNPGSVDVHDITIAQAEARMTLDIAQSVMNRVVQGWKELINTR